MEVIFGAIVLMAGYLLCYFTVKKPKKIAETVDETVEKVKRVKSNLRNPMKTYTTSYDQYKSRKSELYEPQVPKRGDTE